MCFIIFHKLYKVTCELSNGFFSAKPIQIPAPSGRSFKSKIQTDSAKFLLELSIAERFDLFEGKCFYRIY
ncbi:hypothetical protein QMM42_12745 [Leptospira santarosai]|uniref:hypothetical protein n=1 Tax=Leptospira santarosai TaxID=28183 RepID=UPI000248B01E|nr:hypothetical protein [Leptospira santarosai]EMM76846.1 hypothetical protein LEP1GSC040_0976 [Leptospira santarosai str. 2000030832]MDI7187068.1 hypothetical protein [Leptospira santarosai]MDI7199471.1 hypothetical protein [Leptospira santarosai]MDI7207182.1 hypothetical protein [Leptospira santarosai]MDI7220885.1 hypothetical protein [Leptospira santarosai]